MSWGGCVWSAHKYTYNVHWGYIEKVFFYKRVDQQGIMGHNYYWSFIWIFQKILLFHKIFHKSETKFRFWKNEKIYQKLRQVSDVISLKAFGSIVETHLPRITNDFFSTKKIFLARALSHLPGQKPLKIIIRICQ